MEITEQRAVDPSISGSAWPLQRRVRLLSISIAFDIPRGNEKLKNSNGPKEGEWVVPNMQLAKYIVSVHGLFVLSSNL